MYPSTVFKVHLTLAFFHCGGRVRRDEHLRSRSPIGSQSRLHSLYVANSSVGNGKICVDTCSTNPTTKGMTKNQNSKLRQEHRAPQKEDVQNIRVQRSHQKAMDADFVFEAPWSEDTDQKACQARFQSTTTGHKGSSGRVDGGPKGSVSSKHCILGKNGCGSKMGIHFGTLVNGTKD